MTYIDCEVEEGMHFCTSNIFNLKCYFTSIWISNNLRSRKPGSHIGPGLAWLKIYFTLFIKSKIWNTNLFSFSLLNSKYVEIIQDNWLLNYFHGISYSYKSTSGFSEGTHHNRDIWVQILLQMEILSFSLLYILTWHITVHLKKG